MQHVLTIGPNNGVKVYKSLRSASRALSGNGTDGLRRTIARRLDVGGGFVGSVWVQASNYPVGNATSTTF
jgi:hypothetical protein